VRRVAAIAGVAGEGRRVAQILPPRSAKRADAAGGAEPRHANARADRDAGHASADRGDATDNLVPGHDREFGIGKLAVDHVQIGAADAAGRNLDQNLACRRLRNRLLAHGKRHLWPTKNHRAHC
jgi:hypothetical protein